MRNGGSAYLVVQSYKQYYELVVLHSYILEQLVFVAPCEWVHLCLAHGIDCLPFHMVWICYPPPNPLAWCGFWAWLALISVSDLPTPAVPINHTCKFPYNYHKRSKSSYTCITLWAHDTSHIHDLWFLFLFFLPDIRQVGKPQPLTSGTGRANKNLQDIFLIINFTYSALEYLVTKITHIN
jgi:hypothetical protein